MLMTNKRVFQTQISSFRMMPIILIDLDHQRSTSSFLFKMKKKLLSIQVMILKKLSRTIRTSISFSKNNIQRIWRRNQYKAPKKVILKWHIQLPTSGVIHLFKSTVIKKIIRGMFHLQLLKKKSHFTTLLIFTNQWSYLARIIDRWSIMVKMCLTDFIKTQFNIQSDERWWLIIETRSTHLHNDEVDMVWDKVERSKINWWRSIFILKWSWFH